MYHELSDDPSTGYKVNGYFDDKPNPEMPSQCCYLDVQRKSKII